MGGREKRLTTRTIPSAWKATCAHPARATSRRCSPCAAAASSSESTAFEPDFAAALEHPRDGAGTDELEEHVHADEKDDGARGGAALVEEPDDIEGDAGEPKDLKVRQEARLEVQRDEAKEGQRKGVRRLDRVRRNGQREKSVQKQQRLQLDRLQGRGQTVLQLDW